jgi:hypothetical protein
MVLLPSIDTPLPYEIRPAVTARGDPVLCGMPAGTKLEHVPLSPIAAAGGIDLPIFAFTHCRDVVVAVSKAGGFGVLGAVAFSPEQLEIERVRSPCPCTCWEARRRRHRCGPQDTRRHEVALRHVKMTLIANALGTTVNEAAQA